MDDSVQCAGLKIADFFPQAKWLGRFKLPICSFALATDLDVIQVMQINSNPPSLCPWWAPLSSSCHTHSSPVPQVQPLCRGERQRRAQPWALCGTWDKNEPLDKPKIESEKLCFSGLTLILLHFVVIFKHLRSPDVMLFFCPDHSPDSRSPWPLQLNKKQQRRKLEACPGRIWGDLQDGGRWLEGCGWHQEREVCAVIRLVWYHV